MAQLTADDIINEIEFEIAQGVLSKDDLGNAIRAVRQFQNTLRAETFEKIKINDQSRQVLGKQFQVVDMLLTLLEETGLELQALQLEIRKLRKLPEGVLQPTSGNTSEPAGGRIEYSIDLNAHTTDPGFEYRSSDEIENVMRPESIDVGLQTRQYNFPVIGWILTKLRIYYQRPALFYTKLLITRQAPVNRVFGDRILYLEGLIQEQQQQIQALTTQLASGRSEGTDHP